MYGNPYKCIRKNENQVVYAVYSGSGARRMGVKGFAVIKTFPDARE